MMSGQLDSGSHNPATEPANAGQLDPVNPADQNADEPEILMRAILPQNLNSRIAFNALAIKLMEMYIIIAHCPEFDPDNAKKDSGLFSGLVNWAVTSAKDVGAKAGFGESSEAILDLCAELKRDIEKAESFDAYFALCERLFKEAINATVKSKFPRRVPLFFAIIGLMQQVMKIYYPAEYRAKLKFTRGLFAKSEATLTAITNSPNSPAETEEYQHELMRDLIILDDVMSYHIIFRRGSNPYPNLFVVDPTKVDPKKPWLSTPYMTEEEFSAMWSILDNQYSTEFGQILNREELPFYQKPTKNFPLLLNPHFTMYYLFWLNKKISMRDATTQALSVYESEYDKSLRELFNNDRDRFIARAMAAESQTKTRAANKAIDAPAAKKGPAQPVDGTNTKVVKEPTVPPVKGAALSSSGAHNNNAVGNPTQAPQSQPKSAAQNIIFIPPRVASPPVSQTTQQKQITPPAAASSTTMSATLAKHAQQVALDKQQAKLTEVPNVQPPVAVAPIVATGVKVAAPTSQSNVVPEFATGSNDSADDDPIIFHEDYDEDTKKQTEKSADGIRLSGSIGIFASTGSEDEANDNVPKRGISLSQGSNTD